MKMATPSVTARAIMDDFSVVGFPADLLKVVDTYQRLALVHGVAVHPDSCIQIPQGLPTADLVDSADHRGLKIVCGNTDYLGAAVGTNDEQMVE